MNTRLISGVALACLALTSCSTVYYQTMEKLGVHKRDIMVDRVKEARDAQKEAGKEFVNALEQFKSVVQMQGGDLEAKYNKLNAALQRSESRAREVRDRIAAVESVSSALFKEWKAELKQYASAELRASSERQLKDAQNRYKELIGAMKKAESRIEPAIQPLRDQVLFLKHNLNAKAIGGLTNEVASIQAKVNDLVRDMDAAVREADAFIAALAP